VVVDNGVMHRLVASLTFVVANCHDWLGNDSFEGTIKLDLIGDGQILDHREVSKSTNKGFDNKTDNDFVGPAEEMTHKSLESLKVQEFALAEKDANKPALSRASQPGLSTSGGCSTDADCKGGRVCDQGSCRAP